VGYPRLTGTGQSFVAPGISASFKYDPLGRRVEKTVNGQTISYVYGGAQAIGEVTGGTINATLLGIVPRDVELG
jgi:YD repeat-containing protein